MQRLLLLLFIFCASVASLPAQKLLKKAKSYVPVDSIAFLTADKTNLLVAAWSTDSLAKLHHPSVTRSEARNILRRRAKGNRSIHKKVPPQYLPFFSAARRIDEIAATLPWTANGRLADNAESLLLNEILMGLERKPSEHACAEALLQGALMTYMTDEEGIYVNLFQNCIAHIVTNELDLTLDQMTDMPFFPRVKLRLSGIPRDTKLKLRLRKPSWQTTPTTLYVNGHETEVKVENGYFVIERLWKSGDEVYVDFDLTPRIMPDMLITSGPLKYIPSDIPNEPITIGKSYTPQGHPNIEGQGFKAVPMMDM